MSPCEMVNIKAFVERYDREHREREVTGNMKRYNLDRPSAERMYERDRKDYVEAAIVSGEVDPNLKGRRR